MAILKLNSYELFSQSSNNRPEYGSGIPKGTVVQYQYVENPGNEYITSTSYTDVAGFYLSFTPKFSNSLLHIQSTGQIGNNYGSYNNNGIRIYDPGNSSVVGNVSLMQLTTGTGQWVYSCLGIIQANNLDTRIYKVQGYMSGGTSMIVYGKGSNNGYTGHLLVMEIVA